MRVTNSMIVNGYLSNLNNNLSALSKNQSQMATGKRITTISDDPVGVLKSMQMRVKLYRMDQYKANLDTAQTWLKQTETAVEHMNEIVQSAYESTIKASSDYIADSDRKAIAEIIGQLRDHILELTNTKLGDKYIFGGYNTEQKPFTIDSATGNILYNGFDLADDTNAALIAESEQNIEIEIGFGMRSRLSLNGTELLEMGSDNLYAVMDNLYNLLKNEGSTTEISAYTTKLMKAQTNLLAVRAEIGGRTTRLDLVTSRYEDDFLNYTEFKSNIEDVDEAEVIMNYKMAETVYNAALKIGGNIIQPSLVDYLNR